MRSRLDLTGSFHFGNHLLSWGRTSLRNGTYSFVGNEQEGGIRNDPEVSNLDSITLTLPTIAFPDWWCRPTGLEGPSRVRSKL